MELDSVMVVNWITHKSPPPWRYYTLWDDILQLCFHISFFIHHVYREGNGLADGVANLGANGLNASYSSISQLPRPLLGLFNLDK